MLGVEVAREIGAERVPDRHAHEPLVGTLHAPRLRTVRSSAALLAPYDASPWCPPPTVIDERKMTTPLSGRWSSAACATSAGAMALVVMTSCHVSALTSSSGASGETAVENTSASSPPMASTASATIPEQRSGSRDVGRDASALARSGDDFLQLVLAATDDHDVGAGVGGGERVLRPMPDDPPTTSRRWPARSMSTRHGQSGLDDERAMPMPPPAHIESRPSDLAPAAQLVDHRDDHARTGGRDRVTEAAAAAVHVDDRRVDAERADRRHRHRAERLVDLDQVDVVDGEAGTLERLRDRDRRAHAGAGRLDARRWPTTRSGPAGRSPCASA